MWKEINRKGYTHIKRRGNRETETDIHILKDTETDKQQKIYT